MIVAYSPHDKFFKESMTYLEIAKDFFKKYLPPFYLKFIDLDSLELVKDTSTSKELKEYRSDLIFKVDLKEVDHFVCILMEHKSYIDKNIVLQIHKYICQQWDLYSKQKKDSKKLQLPLFLPFILYHGKYEWRVPLDLEEHLNPTPQELVKDVMISRCKISVFDFSGYGKTPIKGHILTQIYLESIKHIYDEDFTATLKRVLYLFSKTSRSKTQNYLESFLEYVMSTRGDLSLESILQLARRILPERSDTVKTIREQLIEEGREKGREEGREEELLTILEKQLKKKLQTTYLPEEILLLMKKSKMEDLRRVSEFIFDITSFEDVRGLLLKEDPSG